MRGPGLGDRRLYLCTPDRPDLAHFLQAAIRGGVDVVQLRETTLSDRALVARARLAAEVCREDGVPFVLNDRPDLALESGADGVHVGQDDVTPVTARRILGAGALLGLSTHASSELRASLDEPVDYLSAGPVSPTPTKPGRPGTGLAYLEEVASASSLPWFVTGGVTPDTVPDMVAAGARRFVVVRWVTLADDPEAAAAALRTAIDTAVSRAAAGRANR